MYHQLLKIGEDGITAEVEYKVDDDDIVVITKITTGQTVIPVGALDLRQIEDMADKLRLAHATVVQALTDDARIDDYEERQRDLEI